jgi:hypothetical protein
MTARPTSTGYNPSRFIPTYNNPDKQTSGETVNKIFLKAVSGKYFDIKRAIMQEQSTLALHDIQNRSILHHILLNTGLDKNDKFELIKMVLEIGAPIDSPDINGTRPLHLAAGQQNKKVIKLLLERGAEPNSKDNNQMSALHHAVNPETFTCKDKTKHLVPDKKQIEIRTDDLFNRLFELFKNDRVVRRYIAHLASIFRYRHVYSDPDNDMKNLNQIVATIIGEPNIPGARQSYREKLVGFTKKLYEMTKNELGKSLSPVPIKENTAGGWAPLLNGMREKKNAFLPFANLGIAFNEVHDNAIKTATSVIRELENKKDIIDKKINDLVTFLTNAEITLDILFLCRHFIHSYGNELSNIMNPQQLRALYTVLNSLFDNLTNISYAPNGEINNTTNFAPFNLSDRRIGYAFAYYTGIIQEMANELSQCIREIKRDMQTNQSNVIVKLGNAQMILINMCYSMLYMDGYVNILCANLDMFRATIENQDLTPVLLHVSEILKDINDNYFNMIKNAPLNIISCSSTPQPALPFARVVPYGKNNLQIVTFQMQNNLQIGKYSDIRITHNDPTSTVCYLNYLYIYDESTLGLKSLPHLQPGVAAWKPNQDHDLSQYVYPYTYPYVEWVVPTNEILDDARHQDEQHDVIENIIENINKLVATGASQLVRSEKSVEKGSMDHLYDSLREFQKQMNSYIDVFNMMNGFIFVNRFNNEMQDNTASKSLITPIDHILNTRMKQFKIFPETYRKFYDTVRATLKITKQNNNIRVNPNNARQTAIDLIKNYGYTVSSLVGDDLIVTDAQGPVTGPAPTSVAIPGIITTFFPFDASVRNTTATTSNHIVIGQHAILINPLAGPKDTIVTEDLSIVSSVFDNHIYIIKLVLIMYFTEYLVNNYRRGIKSPIYDEINKIEQTITAMSPSNPLGTTIAIMAKMIDEILISTLENMANISASNYVEYMAEKNTPASTPGPRTPGPRTPGSPTAPGSNALAGPVERLIKKPSDKTRLRDQAMVQEVIASGIPIAGPSLDVGVLQLFGKFSESDQFTDQNRLIDFDSVDPGNDVCYAIDQDVVGELLRGAADPNIVERSGKTPLGMAVYLQNETVIETLLRSGAKVIFDNKNIYRASYRELLNMIERAPFSNIQEINQRVEGYLLKKTGISTIFTNSKLILGMALYLLDHQMTSNASNYPNMWNREQHLKILSMLGLNPVNYDLIPLAQIDPDIIRQNIKGYMTYNDTINEYRKRLTDARERYLRLNNSKNNMEAEQKELQSINNYRTQELAQLLVEINEQINIIERDIQDMVAKITDLTKKKQTVDQDAARAAQDVNQSIKNSNAMYRLLDVNKKASNICNIYDVFFNQIISTNPGVGLGTRMAVATENITNNEYTAYIKLWNNLLTRPEHIYKQDHTQLITNLQNYILEQGIVKASIFLDAYEPICELYEKVLNKYGRDYQELSMYLDKNGTTDYAYNYVLKQIFCIMHHVFSHTMSINFINTVAQLLARQDTGNDNNELLMDIYRSFTASGFIDHSITNVPRQIIKVVCKISEAEKDPDNAMTVTEILNRAIDILTTSTYQTMNTHMIGTAKELIVPFFVTYMETYTAEMHACMVKQIKNLMVQNRWLQIIKLIAKKAVMES